MYVYTYIQIGMCIYIHPYILASQALLFVLALVLNLLLCSVQVVVLMNLWEYSKDHMYDLFKYEHTH